MLQTSINGIPAVIRFSLQFIGKDSVTTEEVLQIVSRVNVLNYKNECFAIKDPSIGMIVVYVHEGQDVLDVQILQVIKLEHIVE
ncbi:hypothetical protein ACFSCX_18110 [Bacillus salitolerans]|uniref:Uncharacterized protein n=1 Tax=Bacillus salitolerans TaxID=1437434 RepID=A0ABW4LU98_9BACI